MMDGDKIEVTITDFKSEDLFSRLENPLRMNSLPNVLLFVRHVRGSGNQVCFVGPPRCGKTTMIRNLHFALTAKELFSGLGEVKWIQLLLGDLSVTVHTSDPGGDKVLRYMPVSDSDNKDNCIQLAKKLNPSIVFHYAFKKVRSVEDLHETIISETRRVVDVLTTLYPNELTADRLLRLDEKLRSQVTANVHIVFTFFRNRTDPHNTYIFVDDYDVPFCSGNMDTDELYAIQRTISNFVRYCADNGHVCLFGSFSFPSQIMGMEKTDVFTPETAKYRFLGISREKANDYLQEIGMIDYDFTNSSGMLSNISYEIHPLCFHLSVTDPSSLIEIGDEMKSYNFILNALIESAATFELVTTLYSKGWYCSSAIIETYYDSDIINNYKTNDIPMSGCIKILRSLGFIRKYKNSDENECLKKLGKCSEKLPNTYYSFSNVVFYYSFTSFMLKIYEKAKLNVISVPVDMFVKIDAVKIMKLCQDFLDKFAGCFLSENQFAERIFEQLITIFPTFLVVREFVIEGSNYRPDIGMFSFKDDSNAYVWEFKKTDDFTLIIRERS